MTFIGQKESTKKKPPTVQNDHRAWEDVYDILNHLIDSVNSKKTTELRQPGDLHNSIGDIRVFKDKTDNKYYMETMTEDGNARRELEISDKDVRTGKGYYSTSSASEGGGLTASNDSRSSEQKLFDNVPWTDGRPNNTSIDSDGNIVNDNVTGATVSNNNIVEANLVGSGKTFSAGQKPNKTEINSDGELVADGTTTSTKVSNTAITATDIIGSSGQVFASNPLTVAQGKNFTFYQDSIPTALAEGDMWFDTDDENKMYRYKGTLGTQSVVTSGNGWYIVNAVPTLDAITINASQVNAGTIAAARIATSSLTSANISATQINAGTIDAARIATSSLTSANISANNINAGTLSAAEINMSSGTAKIETDGNATFGSGNFKIDSNGNIHIQGASANTGNLYFHESNDTKDYTGNAFRMFHASSGDVFKINYDANNRFELSDGGNLTVQGEISFGNMSTKDCKFTRDSGRIKVSLSSGSAFYPAVNDSHDLGRSSSGYWDDVYATGGVTTSSDSSLKNNIADSTLGLNFIDSLRPVSYKLNNKSRTHYGLIAQEVKSVLDSLSINTNNFAGYVDPSVNEDEGPLALRYSEFISPIIKAIQELKEEIEKLKT